MGGSWGRSGGPVGVKFKFQQIRKFHQQKLSVTLQGWQKYIHSRTLTSWGLRGGGTWGSPGDQPQSSSNPKLLLTKVVRHSLGMKKIPILEGSPTVWSRGCHGYFLVCMICINKYNLHDIRMLLFFDLEYMTTSSTKPFHWSAIFVGHRHSSLLTSQNVIQ